MGELAVVLRAVALLALLLIPGWAVARAAVRRIDAFAVVLWGLAVISFAGVSLAHIGGFSLMSVGCGVAGITVLAAIVGRWRAGQAIPVDAAASPCRAVRLAAGAAGLLACAWVWPPFETFMGAADSTMYVDAGIHLARTGSYEVPDTITPLLPPLIAQAVLPSVGILDRGPFVRLPGGLLMATRDATSATPAFFPLLSVWTGLFAAVGGPQWAPVVAPLSTGLAVWALTLFAGEAFGLAVAVPTALVFLANFAVWWFGRFPMSEPLTLAFVWGGLVFLGRGAPLSAGVMLGLGGVARAETLLFVGAALAWWGAWTPVRGRDLASLIAGVVFAGGLASAGLFAAPNHHVAYLQNDLIIAWTRTYWRALPAISDGRFVAAAALLPVVPLTVALAAWWHGRAIGRNTIRLLVLLAIGIGISLYLRLGGRAEPLRHLGWLATSMSPIGLVLGLAGAGFVWSRGGPAVRLGMALVVLVAVVFVPSPRVAAYQPWAMRRYLPIVLPGLALGAGAVLGSLVQSPRRTSRVLALVLTTIIVGLQIRPVLAVRDAGYYAGSLAGVRRVADRIPADALVVVDGGFADLQIQVPLWLVFGRESVMARGEGAVWRELLSTLVASGRPVYWLQHKLGPIPAAEGLVFTAVPLEEEGELAIRLPNSPADVPPAIVTRRWAPLSLYGVTAGAGAAELGFAPAGGASLTPIGVRALKSSRDTTKILSVVV